MELSKASTSAQRRVGETAPSLAEQQSRQQPRQDHHDYDDITSNAFRGSPIRRGDTEWQDFVDDTSTIPEQQRSQSAAFVSASTFSRQDLQPRVGDGSAVTNLNDEDDTWPTFEAQLHQEQERQSFILSQTQTPYLYSLLSSASDGEALVRYLQTYTYTDDVWRLPEPVRRAMENVRQKEDKDLQKDAVRRLMQLRGHLDIAGSTESSSAQIPYNEWDRIWK